jgi:hypothetical protein
MSQHSRNGGWDFFVVIRVRFSSRSVAKSNKPEEVSANKTNKYLSYIYLLLFLRLAATSSRANKGTNYALRRSPTFAACRATLAHVGGVRVGWPLIGPGERSRHAATWRPRASGAFSSKQRW